MKFVTVTALKPYIVGGPDVQLLLCSRGAGVDRYQGSVRTRQPGVYTTKTTEVKQRQLRVRGYPSRPVESAVEFKLVRQVVHWDDGII